MWGDPNHDAAVSETTSHGASESAAPASAPVNRTTAANLPHASYSGVVAPAAAWGGAGMPEKRQVEIHLGMHERLHRQLCCRDCRETQGVHLHCWHAEIQPAAPMAEWLQNVSNKVETCL